MTGETAEHYSDPDTHLGRLIAYAWQLGTRPWTHERAAAADWHDTYGRLRRWTHMLGFGGHFATKSRRYSTTHKHLRAAAGNGSAPPTPTGAIATDPDAGGRPPTTTPPSSSATSPRRHRLEDNLYGS